MIHCPTCQAPARVLETRWSPPKQRTRRRLGCTSCGLRFTTWGDVMLPEIDSRLDADGLPRYTEALEALEALVRSAGRCPDIDHVAVVKAWSLLDRFKTRAKAP